MHFIVTFSYMSQLFIISTHLSVYTFSNFHIYPSIKMKFIYLLVKSTARSLLQTACEIFIVRFTEAYKLIRLHYDLFNRLYEIMCKELI